MLAEFEQWSATITEIDSLTSLKGSYVGIDAAEYLRLIPVLQVDGINRKIFEELPVALGGQPFGYKAVIQRTVEILKEANITPYFVFSGLAVDKKDLYTFFSRYEQAARTHTFAWKSYDEGDGQNAVETFGKSEYGKPEQLFRFLQQTLHELGVEYMIAPFSASAQLAHMFQERVIDGFWGPSEALMFDVEDVISKVDFVKKEFTFVRKKSAIEYLGNIPVPIFVDACLLAGSDFLPTLPWIESHLRKPTKIQTAVDQILNNNRNGYLVCLRHADNPKFQALNYADAFKRAKMAVQHHIVMSSKGEILVQNVANAPRVHDFMGQRLPDEVYFYLSRGIIGPRVLNWRASGEILEPPPLDNGESEAYRTLIQNQITELRTAAISLLSFSLTRFYQHKDLTIRYWFDKDNIKPITMRDVVDLKPTAEGWKVTEDIFGPKQNKHFGSGLIGIAIQSLTDTEFAARTIAPKLESPKLRTMNEILLNSVWRMLHLRGYVNEDHTLSPWGKTLSATLSALPSPDLEEAAIIAIELARYGYLNYDNFFPTYSGITPPAQDQIRKNMLLLSRVACLGRFKHKQIGFTGALSRQLLGYHSMVSAVRRGLRDLVEMCMTTMLMNHDASRDDRSDWYALGLNLPFLLDNDCGLGLLVNNYLYQLYRDPAGDPKSEEVRGQAREETATVFAHCEDAEGDLKKAFQLWDAIYAGVQTMGKSQGMEKMKKQFEEVEQWQRDLR